MQNSGIGNAINPLVSLADEDVYKIPMILMIGWRGEPGVKDEPQHLKQGKITLSLLEALNIKYVILSDNFKEDLNKINSLINDEKKPVALIIKKDTFFKFSLAKKEEVYQLTRETALEIILENIDKKDIVVSTTGKTSREIFELREKLKQGHKNDFLTVGSMGHTSSIALGISLNTTKKVYCIDGDGSMIMHLGSMGIVAANSKNNYKYILINNGSHESVGGQPSIGFQINIKNILIGLGFETVFIAKTEKQIKLALEKIKILSKTALIIYCKQGSRSDLGRPSISPQENKANLMNFIKS
jgi:phosphonopyruvate decarboxylase